MRLATGPKHTVAVHVLRSLRAYAIALGVLWCLPALLVWALYTALAKEVPDGRCSGIGFGCTLSPADSVVLLGIMAFPVLCALGIAAVVLIAVVQFVHSRRDRPAGAPPVKP